ncbi:hypothetical protein DL98DRAFT_536593 [Cadophora sp. DSE1049]|nr:hypothetical protein DL98DRAFT_536593 [Cadophora sp. DSE1049]
MHFHYRRDLNNLHSAIHAQAATCLAFRRSGVISTTRRESCVLAHIWEKAKEVQPEEITKSFDEATARLDGLRMDGGYRGKADAVLHYTIILDGEEHQFETSTLSPCTGFCTINYCRYPHTEVNENEYCVKYMTSRTHGEDYGGAFFLTDYGVMIPSREDQVVSWQGGRLHGTALLKVDPFDKDPVAKWLESKVFSDPKESPSRAVLDDTGVKPRPRPTMIQRKPRPAEKIYKGDIRETFNLPTGHAYSSKKWTRKVLEEECLKRAQAGTLEHYFSSWSVDKLKATLLKNDGVEVEVIQTVRKKPVREAGDNHDVGQSDEEGEDDI